MRYEIELSEEQLRAICRLTRQALADAGASYVSSPDIVEAKRAAILRDAAVLYVELSRNLPLGDDLRSPLPAIKCKEKPATDEAQASLDWMNEAIRIKATASTQRITAYAVEEVEAPPAIAVDKAPEPVDTCGNLADL